MAETTLRHRLWLCVLMGGVPLFVALLCLAGRSAGLIVSENAIRLSNVVIFGGLVTLILAMVVSLHLVVEARVQRSVTDGH